jgi:hypothetical protein
MTEKPSAMGTGKKSTRFKPGQSGNPAGRPRKEKYPIRYQGHFRKTIQTMIGRSFPQRIFSAAILLRHK